MDGAKRRDKAPAFNDPSIWTTLTRSGMMAGEYSSSISENLNSGYRHWNAVCLSLISKHIGAVGWYLTHEVGDELSEIYDHPMIDLLRYPNPNTNKREFMERSSLHLDLTGNCFWYLDRNIGRQVRRLWILRPDLVEIKFSTDGIIRGYIYRPSESRDIFYDADSVVHIRHSSPIDEFWGVAPLDTMRESFDLDANIRIFLDAFFKNMARPDLLISVKSTMTESQRKRFADAWNDLYKGAMNVGKPAIMEGDATVTPLSYSNSEQQFKDLSDWVRRCILNAYAIPEALFDPSSNRATAFQADTTFNRECIIPRLEKFSEALDRVAAMAGMAEYRFAYENPVPRDREWETSRNINYVNAGILTPNEVREMEGYEPLPEGDTLNAAVPTMFGNDSPAVEKVSAHDALAQKWYAYVERHKKKEGPLRAAISRAFDWDRKEIKKRLSQAKGIAAKGIGDVFPPDKEWAAAWAEMIGDDAFAPYADFFKSTATQLGIDWDINDPRMKQNFYRLLDRGIDDVTNTTRNKLSKIIADKLSDSASTGDIAKAIDDAIDGWQAGKSRAWTIARTETTKISNAAIIDAGKEAEAETGKRVVKVWIAAVDERTRDSHLSVNGEEVPLDDTFSNGLTAPGIGNDPAEIVNCRCTSEVQFQEE
jgi:HK97 family phage portal protein